jgi:hypothetical protein
MTKHKFKFSDIRWAIERTVVMTRAQAKAKGFNHCYRAGTHRTGYASYTVLTGPFHDREQAVTYAVGHTEGSQYPFKIHPILIREVD